MGVAYVPWQSARYRFCFSGSQEDFSSEEAGKMALKYLDDSGYLSRAVNWLVLYQTGMVPDMEDTVLNTDCANIQMGMNHSGKESTRRPPRVNLGLCSITDILAIQKCAFC